MEFRNWLEGIESNDIYHYSPIDSDEMIVDPKFFGKNAFSRNERKIPIKRSFFYLNPKESESFFTNEPLYKATIDKNKIYNLSEDPLNYKEEIMKNNNGALDVSELLDKIHKNENYIGVFYRIHGTIGIVSLFVPVHAQRVR